MTMMAGVDNKKWLLGARDDVTRNDESETRGMRRLYSAKTQIVDRMHTFISRRFLLSSDLYECRYDSLKPRSIICRRVFLFIAGHII